jgi:Tol biopolymer transport system component
VAFASTATNLVPGDTNKTFDVFVRDRVLGTTERVSVATSGAQAVGGPSGSSHPAISANGRFVAFDSDATNLVPGDTNGVRDVFVHDRLTGTTTRVSRPTPSGQANGSSHGPAISASGQFVAFYSFATNLVTGDTNGEGDVFLHNRAAAGTTVRVSVATGGAEAIGGGSFSPVVSAEGRYIVFQSLATNLVPDDFNGVGDYFVRDRLAGTTSRLSIAPDGTEGDAGGGLHRAISADGRIAVFASDATTLVDSDTNGATDVFVARVPVGPNWLVVGQGAGGDPGLRGFDADGGATFLDRLAFAGGFTGGVRVATADLDGDGMPEIITARGPGSLPQVRVFRGSSAGSVKATFLAYPASFTGGAYVAAGDVDGDGIPEIVTAAGAGSAGPLVRIYKLGPPVPILGTPVTLATLFTEFFVYDPAFTGGISVAVGDVTGDGIAEVITGGGPGAGSHVRIHQIGPAGAVTELLSFYVDSPVFPGGVTVAAGDVDGDGKAELIVGLGPGGLPRVWVYGVDPVFIFGQFAGYVASLVAELDAYDPLFGGGINVGAGDTDGDGRANVITGAGPGGGPHVRTFAVDGGTLVPQLSFFAYDPAFTGGVFPAGLP